MINSILIGIPNASFSESLGKGFERSGLEVLAITVTLDHFLEEAYSFKTKNKQPSAILLSTSITQKGNQKNLEQFVDVVMKLREDFEQSAFLILSNEDVRHPIHAELISIGVFNIFPRNEQGKNEISISKMIDCIENPLSFIELKDMRNYDPSISWRKIVRPDQHLKISIENQTNNDSTNASQPPDKEMQTVKDSKPQKSIIPESEFPFESTEQETWDSVPQTKVVYKDRIIGKSTIAIASLSSGLGATHTSILVSNYLASLGYKTKHLQCNKFSNEYNQIENAFNGQRNHEKLYGNFEINNVHYVKNVEPDELIGHMDGFSHIVFDLSSFDTLDNRWENEFLRCSVQIIVAPNALWREEEVSTFIKDHPYLDFDKIIFLLPAGDDRQVKDLQSLNHAIKTIYPIPFTSDPFSSSDQIAGLMNQIFDLPQKSMFASPKILAIAASAIIFIVCVVFYLI